MLTTRTRAALALALALGAGGAAPAAAGDGIPATIDITYDTATSGFVGHVASPNMHCLAGRMITITRFEGDTPTTIGTATTEADGAFAFADPDAMAGTYETTVAAKRVKGKKRKGRKRPIYNCGFATTGKMQL